MTIQQSRVCYKFAFKEMSVEFVGGLKQFLVPDMNFFFSFFDFASFPSSEKSLHSLVFLLKLQPLHKSFSWHAFWHSSKVLHSFPLFLSFPCLPLIFTPFIMHFSSSGVTSLLSSPSRAITKVGSVQFIWPVTVKFFGAIDSSLEKRSQENGDISWNVHATQFSLLPHI